MFFFFSRAAILGMRAIGKGHAAANTLSGYLNMPKPLSSSNWTNQSQQISESVCFFYTCTTGKWYKTDIKCLYLSTTHKFKAHLTCAIIKVFGQYLPQTEPEQVDFQLSLK